MAITSNLNRTRRSALAAALCWTAAGCGDAPLETAAQPVASVAEATSSLPAPLSLASQAASVQAPASPTPEIAPVPPAGDEAPPTPVTDYKPPFPDRVDLFVAPKREGGAHALGDAGSVELLGFVEVDQPRAVLSINGQVTPLAAGSIENGIEVISIQPPMVLLQRGRQRWQATLEN